MRDLLNYPFDANTLLRKKKALRREMLQQSGLLDKRIAILGGSTTAEIRDMLELFLLKDGIRPEFYESGYNRYSEDILFPNSELEQFAPEIVYIYTSCVNITEFPSFEHSENDIKNLLHNEIDRYQVLWDRITAAYSCPIIQNNFELPHYRGLGNLDGYDIHGRSRFIAELNRIFSEQARFRQNLHLNDINYLSAWFGLERWHDKIFWYSYKYAMNYEAIPLLADSVASIIKAIFGKTRKCLVLDLDNTLWGGVIGDDGVSGIQIGKDTPEAEAYTEFQEYAKYLKERGIILAVCSKNDYANACEGFNHPDNILRLEDFSSFYANWEPKHQNIREIAKKLNIGIDCLVFADDNPVERDAVRSQEPQVAVPELGNNVALYINILDKTGYFETVSLSTDDLQRSSFYEDNAVRRQAENKFDNYDEFLRSLKMKAEIKEFSPIYLDRITQIINKTNQFNVTTRRYTQGEIEAISVDSKYITLYGRLADKFGDNGLISIMITEQRGAELHINVWLMSCRVLKREMERAMFDQLVCRAKEHGIKTIYGYYYPSKKNGIVKDLFQEMGFVKVNSDKNGNTLWRFDIPEIYRNTNMFIEVSK
jgi:FkbH-like protein